MLEAKVRFHALANYTMIRNWVGQSTSQDFYDMCDKYGILIWDEMFQANQSDGPQVGGNPSPNDTPGGRRLAQGHDRDVPGQRAGKGGAFPQPSVDRAVVRAE